MKNLIDKLCESNELSKNEIIHLLENIKDDDIQYLFEKACEVRKKYYGDDVYMRGLIEFTNHCKRNCTYCGIRAGNKNADRYRLDKSLIFECCDMGYKLGYRTFVLQGGEDDYYTDDNIVSIISGIKKRYNDVAVTLSLGEKSKASYQKYFDAGADRYLLRHETASDSLYKKLHPGMNLANRKKCLEQLKEIGYQLGAGFMVGLPGQTPEHYAEDLIFLKKLNPHMVGIGPFIPHKDTPLADEEGGTLKDTIIMMAIVRLLLPAVLLPSTTALGTIDPTGREKGLKAGGNIVMPNLSPTNVRSKYLLYDGKICTGDEAAECRMCIEGRINRAGYKVNMSKGDYYNWRKR